MQVGATLTPAEFKDLHNGICKFYALKSQLEGVLVNSLIQEMTDGLELIEKALKASRDAEEAFDDANRDTLSSLEQELEIKHSNWAMEEVPASKMHNVAFKNVRHLSYDNRSVMFEKTELTWADLWQAADYLIGKSSRRNHVFVEEFKGASCDTIGDYLVLKTGS